MLEAKSHVFDYSGLARISDLGTADSKRLFAFLKEEQDDFTSKEAEFRSAEYMWPRTPLYSWSRVWEYPYVYYQIKRWHETVGQVQASRVLDFGSGVTFFPFAVAKLGISVTCADNDTICEKDLSRAVSVVPHQPGKIDFRLCNGSKLPFDDNEMDGVYSVSVLEHILQFEDTLDDIVRVLRPGGLLVLTVDLDLRGDSEIGIIPHMKLTEILSSHFDYLSPLNITHPLDILHSASGPYGFSSPDRFSLAWFNFKQHVVKPILGEKERSLHPFSLGCQAFAMTKKA